MLEFMKRRLKDWNKNTLPRSEGKLGAAREELLQEKHKYS